MTGNLLPARSSVMSKRQRALHHLRRYRILRCLREKVRSDRSRRRQEAQAYVGTNRISGEIQFALLRREGLQPTSRVLEVGCGVLHAGIPLMRFLEPEHFVAIDPNDWLREPQLQKRAIRRLVDKKRARFLSRDDFDASELGVEFDYVLSHSILTHAGYSQLAQLLHNVAGVLAPGGKIVASIFLAEGNSYGSDGSPDKDDSRDEHWVYPGVSWFKLSTVEEAAAAEGFTTVVKPEYTPVFTRENPRERHDWLVLTATPRADRSE